MKINPLHYAETLFMPCLHLYNTPSCGQTIIYSTFRLFLVLCCVMFTPLYLRDKFVEMALLGERINAYIISRNVFFLDY